MNSSLADTWNDDIACMGNHFDQTQASFSWVTLQLFMRGMRMSINANPPPHTKHVYTVQLIYI